MTPTDEITDLVSRYEAAFNDNDAARMNDLFARDAVFVSFGGNLVFGAEDLLVAQEAVFGPGGPLELVKVRYAVESLVFLSDVVAVVHARQRTLDGPVADGRDPMEGVLLLVVVRHPAGWTIHVGQNTPVRQPSAVSPGR